MLARTGLRRAMSALALLAAVVFLPGCRSLYWSPDSKNLALDAGGVLRTFDVDAARLTTLDTGGRYVVGPTYSPDGRSLAYIGITRQGTIPKGVDLWLRDLAGGQERRLTAKVIATDLPSMPTEPGKGASLDVLSLVIKIVSPVNWSPDGQRLIYTRVTGESAQIESVPVAGGAVTVLVNMGRGTFCPVLSPDGRQLVFLVDSPGGHAGPAGSGSPDLFVAGVDGKNPRRLWSGDDRYQLAPFFTPAWTRDGSGIIVATMKKQGGAARDLASALKGLMNVDMRVLSLASNLPAPLALFTTPLGSVDPGLKAVAYIGGEGQDSVVYKTAPFKSARILDKIPSQSSAPADGPELPAAFPTPQLSPDGRFVAVALSDVRLKKSELRLYEPAATGPNAKRIFPLQ